MHKHLRNALVAAALLTTGAAQATPYAIFYSGTIGATTIPTVPAGERYTMTLVLDNDGSSPNGQTWERGHVVCTLLHFGNAGGTVLTHNVAQAPVPAGTGTVTTDASGALTGMFGTLFSSDTDPSNTTVANLNGPDVSGWEWDLGEPYAILSDNFTSAYDDSNNANPPSDIALWSRPQVWPHACNASAPRPTAPPQPGPAPSATPVPTLSEWGVLLLSGLLGWQALPSSARPPNASGHKATLNKSLGRSH